MTTQVEQEILKKIQEIVTSHYSQRSDPLLLADLGIRLNTNLKPFGKTLTQFIVAANNPDLIILRDNNTPAFVVVTTSESKPFVEAWLDRRKQITSIVPDLGDLPRSVLIAFCVLKQPHEKVYICNSAPFRYEIKDIAAGPDPEMIEVEERYRRPGLKVSTLTELSATDRLDLQTKIITWSKDKNVPLGRFNGAQSKKSTNALERLLAAQRDGIAEKIMVPGDIALLLVRHE